jgi:hypothetical protein
MIDDGNALTVAAVELPVSPFSDMAMLHLAPQKIRTRKIALLGLGASGQ